MWKDLAHRSWNTCLRNGFLQGSFFLFKIKLIFNEKKTSHLVYHFIIYKMRVMIKALTVPCFSLFSLSDHRDLIKQNVRLIAQFEPRSVTIAK
jgi:hypothetical protein